MYYSDRIKKIQKVTGKENQHNTTNIHDIITACIHFNHLDSKICLPKRNTKLYKIKTKPAKFNNLPLFNF